MSRSEEENHPRLLAEDAILKHIQMKLETLNVLDKIKERFIKFESYMSNIKENISELEKGLNFVNSELAEMKENMEKKQGRKRKEGSLKN